jgi:excinuclease ABC subunit B
MGIATWHEVKPSRSSSSTSPLEGEVGAKRREGAPRKPSLDEMGPGVESVPAQGGDNTGPRSKLGRPGQHGGFKSNKRR